MESDGRGSECEPVAVLEPEGQLALPLPELKPTLGFGWQTIELVKAPAPRARELDWPSLLRRTGTLPSLL
jgi:hypothetical protein